MKNFKTVVGRISYSGEFDKYMKKETEKLMDAGVNPKTITKKYSIGDGMLCCFMEYTEPKETVDVVTNRPE